MLKPTIVHIRYACTTACLTCTTACLTCTYSHLLVATPAALRWYEAQLEWGARAGPTRWNHMTNCQGTCGCCPNPPAMPPNPPAPPSPLLPGESLGIKQIVVEERFSTTIEVQFDQFALEARAQDYAQALQATFEEEIATTAQVTVTVGQVVVVAASPPAPPAPAQCWPSPACTAPHTGQRLFPTFPTSAGRLLVPLAAAMPEATPPQPPPGPPSPSPAPSSQSALQTFPAAPARNLAPAPPAQTGQTAPQSWWKIAPPPQSA